MEQDETQHEQGPQNKKCMLQEDEHLEHGLSVDFKEKVTLGDAEPEPKKQRALRPIGKA